jgi:DNA polymerase V
MATHGGARTGAGRKVGTGKYAEPTVTRRVPQSIIPLLNQLLEQHKPPQGLTIPNPTDAHLPDGVMQAHPMTSMRIPLALDSVRAGFPSPAAPYIADYLDFNEYLVSNPSATIAVYAKGDSMILAGIDDGDMLVVNRAIEPKARSIALVELDNEFTVKRIVYTPLGIELHPENSNYPVIKPSADSIINLVGVVTHIIKKTL